MAFIKQTEREKLIKKTEQNYGLRKFLITAEIILLIGFIVVTFLSFFFSRQGGEEAKIWEWFQEDDGKITGLTPMGIGMLIWAIIVAGLGIASLILTWTLRSPKTIKKTINKLNSSALSGKRTKGKRAVDVARSRTTIQKKK